MDYESKICEHIVYQSEHNSLKSVDSLEKILRFHVGNFSDSQNKLLLNFANSFNTYLEKSSEVNAKNAANDLSKIYKNFSEFGVSSKRRFWNKQLKKVVDAYRVCIDHHLEECRESINFYLENLENEVMNLGLTFSRQWPGGGGEFENFYQFKHLTATLDTKIKKLEEISNNLQSDIQKNDIEKIKENSKSYRDACGEYFNILGKLFESLFGSDKKVKKIESELYKNLGFEINFKLGYGAEKFFKPTESECIEYEQKLFNNIINQKSIMANSLDRFEYLLKFHFGYPLGGVVTESVFYKFANEFNRLVNDTKSYNYNPKDFNETLDNIYKTFCEKRRKFKGSIMWNDNLKKLLESYKSFAEDYYNQEVGIVKSIKK